MTWTKTGDDYFDRMAALGVSRDAQLMDLECIVFCNRILSDGVLKRTALRKATTADDPLTLSAELVAIGVWVEMADGWQLDWSEQRSREAVLADRERETARKQRQRDRQHRHAAGDHSICWETSPCRAVPGGTRTRTPARKPPGVPASRPVPSRRERDGGNGAARAAAPCPTCDDARTILTDNKLIPCPDCQLQAVV